MQDNRRKFTDNEKMILYQEVNGRCPFCGKKLTHKKNKKTYKNFEIAHIYPVNPIKDEIELLKDKPRLSEDVNDIKNVIAVCSICHKEFDTPRTSEEYDKWFRLKQKLIQDATIKNTYELFNIELDIKIVLEKLNIQNIEEELIELSLESLKIDDKVNSSLPNILKRTIKRDVVDYFDYIKRVFINMNKVTPYKFETLASQVKSFYCKCAQINDSQEYIYNELVNWLDEKTDSYSRKACEIVIAYFIQNCEVFS